ncbi:MAG: anaerobic carbon-monoxide dehydrogenase catalytic subunit [Desulfohalobiaceae bacterium]
MQDSKFSQLTITRDGRQMLAKAKQEGIETVWERYQNQLPHCGFCELGLSCRNCSMGPCRIDPFGEGPQQGVCGADADIIVSRNLVRMIASGAAAHSDHGRDLVEVLAQVGEGQAPGYAIKDEAKLRRLAQEYGLQTEAKQAQELARELAWAMQEDYGTRKKQLRLVSRAPEPRRKLWEAMGLTPRGIDRETSEMMHRTHMGVDNDWQNILLQGLRNALSDGWGGSMLATEVSDILFGTPEPVPARVNLGVLSQDQVNISVHGHNPIVSEMVRQACQEDELLQKARDKGASGINLVGLCCTGNELLMRQGLPVAGNHLMTELALITGAMEMMLVDYQCIMPSLGQVASCYHTLMISTSDKAKFPAMEHQELHPENAREKARELVSRAIDNFARRDPSKVEIPGQPVDLVGGFSVEAVLKALGGSLDPLLQALKAGKIRGAAGIVGCNNPRIRHDQGHTVLARRLIENDVLVLDTGCAAVANAKAGLEQARAAEQAGPGLKEVCSSLGIPPVLHFGSCVDNVRILVLAAELAKALNQDISALPLAGAAPEWYSEKAVSIGAYCVASGIYTVLGPTPPVAGSTNVTSLLTHDLEDILGASFAVEPDPEQAARLILQRIESKRKGLGLDSRRV